jgi:hypothetical protein
MIIYTLLPGDFAEDFFWLDLHNRQINRLWDRGYIKKGGFKTAF